MPTHATAQLIGGRSYQCDATATYTIGKTRAYVLLDGMGDEQEVGDWTRSIARPLAHAAARRADAEVGLRVFHAQVAEERAARGLYSPGEPCAVAVVAVVVPGELVQVAWCGDARAYVLHQGGRLERLTSDHNDRQRLLDMGMAPGPGARHVVRSFLGYSGELPQIGAAIGPDSGRLLLASDGAYEPLEGSCRDLSAYLTGGVHEAARSFVEAAIDHGSIRPDNATVLVADFG
ncbi:PP2C family protein-serine/threonine phosphatase [Streptomyces cavernae]|uniref:PP2C family protein-serine/threonine phosphatase n=1 Tax=Streptomyces cavernae TaxID=2259034 RepID=UPI000FEBB747|nr:mucin-2 [Streptomyces cavernae]